jgi:hypothetical protein
MFMERNKWEAEFKTKLNQREITPTPHAWDRLDALLNAADAKDETKPVRKLNWMYIAAGIAAFLLLSTLFLMQGNQKNQQQTNDVVVEQPPKIESGDKNEVMPISNVNPEKQTQMAEIAPVQKQEKTQQQNTLKPNAIQRDIQHQYPVAQQETEKAEPEHRFEAPTNAEKVNNHDVNAAQEQLASTDPKMQSPKGVKVDPKSLLSQVDGELDLTFREKTIKSISKKYKDVKVALANRNNQQ